MNSVGPFNKWIIVLMLVTVLLCECYIHSKNDDALFSQPIVETTYQGTETTHNINQDFECFQIKSICKFKQEY